jgi:hypothetical protein
MRAENKPGPYNRQVREHEEENMPESEPKNQKKKVTKTNRARYGQQDRLGV